MSHNENSLFLKARKQTTYYTWSVSLGGKPGFHKLDRVGFVGNVDAVNGSSSNAISKSPVTIRPLASLTETERGIRRISTASRALIQILVSIGVLNLNNVNQIHKKYPFAYNDENNIEKTTLFTSNFLCYKKNYSTMP